MWGIQQRAVVAKQYRFSVKAVPATKPRKRFRKRFRKRLSGKVLPLPHHASRNAFACEITEVFGADPTWVLCCWLAVHTSGKGVDRGRGFNSLFGQSDTHTSAKTVFRLRKSGLHQSVLESLKLPTTTYVCMWKYSTQPQPSLPLSKARRWGAKAITFSCFALRRSFSRATPLP